MKTLLTAAFCLLTGFFFSQTVHSGNVTWETIERQIKAYQFSHPVIRKIDVSEFYKRSTHLIIFPTTHLRFSPDICKKTSVVIPVKLPAEVVQILRD